MSRKKQKETRVECERRNVGELSSHPLDGLLHLLAGGVGVDLGGLHRCVAESQGVACLVTLSALASLPSAL